MRFKVTTGISISVHGVASEDAIEICSTSSFVSSMRFKVTTSIAIFVHGVTYDDVIEFVLTSTLVSPIDGGK